ncbi:MAG: Gfo/Idh/MocA family oxidoreductase [Sedimentisphaerales bacterium]|nr:Gfo/Idh/MocA family oxidoreductase [Sedimentisphaerales bacterium]
MSKIARRSFLKKSMATVAGTGLGSALLTGCSNLPASSWSRVKGANDDIRIGIAGMRKQGIVHIDQYSKVSGVRIVALCDCDTQFIGAQVDRLKSANIEVETYVDIRKMLDDPNIDAVSLPIPDHWHALAAIWACQAGKDVYVEKPMAYSIWEGRKMVEAARKYQRIVAAGSQERSDTGLIAAAESIKNGDLGKVKYMHAISYSPRQSIGKVNGPQIIPATCDYNLFQGPAPMEPLMRTSLHYDWHWYWPTGTGEIGNLGGHVLDDCRWMTGLDKVPQKAISLGGRWGYVDDGQTPNTQISYYEYPTPIIYEIRGIPQQMGMRGMGQGQRYKGINFGLVIQCEEGYFAGGRGGGWTYDNQGNRIKQFPGDSGGGHMANFRDAVRSRKYTDLKADVLEGHISAAMPFMANVSYRLGRQETPEKIKEIIGDNELLQESFSRMIQYLEENKINIEQSPITIGPVLTMDLQKEQFTGEYSDMANIFVKRDFREPFVIPDNV